MSISHLATSQSRLRIIVILSICLALVALGSIAFPSHSRAKVEPTLQATAVGKRRRPQFVPGEVLVRYRSESLAKNRTGAAQVTTSEGFALPIQVERFEGSDLVEGLRLARVPMGETLQAVAALRTHPEVLYAEPNYILHADVTTPNDTQFGQQYGLTKIGAPLAWDTTTGSSTIVVGVIDQGIDITHEDLAANIWTNPAEIPGNGVDDDTNGFLDDVRGFNFFNNNGTIFSGDVTEDHASHVAGIIGAVGHNNKGVSGVNWSVGLMSLKFLDADGSGNTANAIRACNYAKQMRDLWETSQPVHSKGANIRVLNASFGGAAFTQSFLDAITGLNNAGILFVAAAGNIDDGTREPNNDLVPHYPSNFNVPNVISVAATNSADLLPSFSHFGATTVDLGAPGSQILSTVPGDYKSFSGTSMSTPHVSGAAALLWAQNPNLTVSQVKSLLLLNGDVVTPLVDKTLTGRRLNVGNSFQSLSIADTTAPGTVGSFQINSQTGRTINLGWTASGDDGASGTAALYQVSFTDGSSGAVIPLKGVVPNSSGSVQAVDVKIPFRHTAGTLSLREFDNVGNEGVPASLPINVPLSAGDPYTSSVGNPVVLSTGGSRLNLNADDSYSDFLLPSGFTFPFFGSSFSSVTISTNGSLYFSNPPDRENGDADDVPSAPGSLGGYKMIAGLWEDIDLRNSSRSDSGVYVVQPNANQIIFRWQGVPCNFDGNVCQGGDPINFEIELRSDGIIKSRYGSGNTSLFPTVGIGGGEPDGYVITSHTSEETPLSLTNAGEVTFIPRAQSTNSVQFSQLSFNVNENATSLTVTVTRTGGTAGVASVNYQTTDTDTFTVGCSDIVNNQGGAYARCDYSTTLDTLTFAAGETSKTFTIPIIDDSFAEGNETFGVSLSIPSSVVLGVPAFATVTITDNETVNAANPIFNTPFFVRQHYLDFLSREPEAGEPWSNVLNNCSDVNNNPACDRLTVSAAFFGSPEFQLKGYFVYRFYKLAFNRLPSYLEIVTDMRAVTGQTAGEVFQKKAAYTNSFVNRLEFVSQYIALLNQQYVTTLMGRYGLSQITTPDPAQPDGSNKVTLTITDLTNRLNASTLTRAQVLRAIADSDQVFAAEFNQAFVAMQYFGYLRRAPETAGYNAWLTYLNANPTDSRTMVNGFMNSSEFRLRFGPGN